jgi:hypothetical protein
VLLLLLPLRTVRPWCTSLCTSLPLPHASKPGVTPSSRSALTSVAQVVAGNSVLITWCRKLQLHSRLRLDALLAHIVFGLSI